MCVAGRSKAVANLSVTTFELSQHAKIARSCLRQVGNQVCDQVCVPDSVMEFSLKQVADRFELSRQARFELVGASWLHSVMEFGINCAVVRTVI